MGAVKADLSGDFLSRFSPHKFVIVMILFVTKGCPFYTANYDQRQRTAQQSNQPKAKNCKWFSFLFYSRHVYRIVTLKSLRR